MSNKPLIKTFWAPQFILSHLFPVPLRPEFRRVAPDGAHILAMAQIQYVILPKYHMFISSQVRPRLRYEDKWGGAQSEARKKKEGE